MPLKKNSQYTEILKLKGEKYLKGWVRVDAQSDPKGASIRMAHFNKHIEGVL